MNEVVNNMGIEMNYAKSDNRFSESESNNRVIKWRFRIAYYWFIYKKIPRIVIFHLAINMKRHLNMFPAKVGLSAHYILHMILSQKNWGYNKHFQVECSAYV